MADFDGLMAAKKLSSFELTRDDYLRVGIDGAYKKFVLIAREWEPLSWLMIRRIPEQNLSGYLVDMISSNVILAIFDSCFRASLVAIVWLYSPYSVSNNSSSCFFSYAVRGKNSRMWSSARKYPSPFRRLIEMLEYVPRLGRRLVIQLVIWKVRPRDDRQRHFCILF